MRSDPIRSNPIRSDGATAAEAAGSGFRSSAQATRSGPIRPDPICSDPIRSTPIDLIDPIRSIRSDPGRDPENVSKVYNCCQIQSPGSRSSALGTQSANPEGPDNVPKGQWLVPTHRANGPDFVNISPNQGARVQILCAGHAKRRILNSRSRSRVKGV